MKTLLTCVLAVISSLAFSKEIVVLAEFTKKPDTKLIQKINHIAGVKKIKLFDAINSEYFSRLYEIKLDEKKLADLKSIKELNKVESIYRAEAFSLIPAERNFSNDIFSSWQWGIMNQGQDILQDLDDINSQTLTGVENFDIGLKNIRSQLATLMKKDVLVAVLDSGVDLDHEDLKGNIFKNNLECKNGELPYGTLTDKDGNGLAGDCMGWNFVNNNNRPYDEKGHGTHVAGVIAAVSDNGKGIAGPVPQGGPQIKILPVKVYQGAENIQDNSMSVFTDKVTKGILYAVKMKVDVVNLSLGWPKIMDTEYLRQAVALAQKNGITIVAAAGNNGHTRPLYPCSYEGVVCVGATTVTGEAASFSNFGSHVDIAAPGEQILSTFPKKIEPSFFSTLGYEIKNGTSQAAPFVSACAGILKSIYPEITNDDIYARLISSAKPVFGAKYYLSGAMQLEKAIAGFKGPQLVPVLKGLDLAHFKMSSSSFELNIPIKNFGDFYKGGELRVVLNKPGIHLKANTFTLPKLNKGEITIIRIIGQIDDVAADAHLKLKLSFNNGQKSSEIYHEVLLVRDLTEDTFIQKVRLENKGFNNEIAALVKQGMFSKLRTVDDVFMNGHNPEYYFDRIDPVSKSLELWIFTEANGIFSARKTLIPDASRVGAVRRLDLNYDGNEDYFVESKSSQSNTKLIYSFLRKNLQALFSVGHFTYEVKESYSSPNKMAFVAMKTSEGLMALPAFIEQGFIPEKDKNPDVWNPESKNMSTHAYYFEPDFSKATMGLRLVDNYRFDKRIETELQKKWDETREFFGQGSAASTLLYQSQSDFIKGKASFLFSLGITNNRRAFEATLSTNFSLTIRPIEIERNGVEADIRLSLTKIENGKVNERAGSVFANLQANNLARMVFITEDGKNTELRYDHFSMRDSIVSPMGAVLFDGKFTSYYQTKNNIVSIHSDGQTKTYPIERVSFITGQAFSELYYPMVVNLRPAFYVDATKIHSGHIFVVKENADGFISPMKNNVFLPNNCSTMNPVKYKGDESFAFLCSEGNDLVMNYLSLH